MHRDRQSINVSILALLLAFIWWRWIVHSFVLAAFYWPHYAWEHLYRKAACVVDRLAAGLILHKREHIELMFVLQEGAVYGKVRNVQIVCEEALKPKIIHHGDRRFVGRQPRSRRYGYIAQFSYGSAVCSVCDDALECNEYIL